jgi:hypothetical protein
MIRGGVIKYIITIKEKLMSINSVAASNTAYLAWQANNNNSIGQNLQNLSNALNSGNLTDAQSAFASITQNLQSTGGNYSNTGSQLSASLQSLQTALQSGDLASAQQALSTFQQNAQTISGKSNNTQNKQNDEDGSTSTTSSASNSTQALLQAFFGGLASMQTALSSGSLDDANDAFSQLNSNSGALSILTGDSQGSQTLQSLQGSLQAGDVNAAQSSLSSLIQNIKSSTNGNAIGNIVDVDS